MTMISYGVKAEGTDGEGPWACSSIFSLGVQFPMVMVGAKRWLEGPHGPEARVFWRLMETVPFTWKVDHYDVQVFSSPQCWGSFTSTSVHETQARFSLPDPEKTAWFKVVPFGKHGEKGDPKFAGCYFIQKPDRRFANLAERHELLDAGRDNHGTPLMLEHRTLGQDHLPAESTCQEGQFLIFLRQGTKSEPFYESCLDQGPDDIKAPLESVRAGNNRVTLVRQESKASGERTISRVLSIQPKSLISLTDQRSGLGPVSAGIVHEEAFTEVGSNRTEIRWSGDNGRMIAEMKDGSHLSIRIEGVSSWEKTALRIAWADTCKMQRKDADWEIDLGKDAPAAVTVLKSSDTSKELVLSLPPTASPRVLGLQFVDKKMNVNVPLPLLELVAARGDCNP
jgi:hypothetical protein